MRIILLILCFATAVSATPRTMVDLTQFDMKHYDELHKLRADVCMATVGLTPELRGPVLKEAIRRLGCRVVMSTDGGIDSRQLLDEPNWTNAPRTIGGSHAIMDEAGINLSYLMLYTEFNLRGEHATLLTNEELLRARALTNNRTRIIPLIRAFDGFKLTQTAIKETMKLSPRRFPGIFIEIGADVPYAKQVRACDMLQFAHSNKRFPIIMLAGKALAGTYANDVKLTCEYLKKTCPGAFLNDKTIIGVAFYEKEKELEWIGGPDSVSEALRKLKRCIR